MKKGSVSIDDEILHLGASDEGFYDFVQSRNIYGGKYSEKLIKALTDMKPMIDKVIVSDKHNSPGFICYWGLNGLNNHYTYDHINKHNDLTLAAAIWILDTLKKYGKLEEAYKYLPKTPIDIKELRIPAVKDSEHSDELLAAMVYTIQHRHQECIDKNTRFIVSDYNLNSIGNEAVMKTKSNYDAIISLIPEKVIGNSISDFKKHYFTLVEIAVECVKHFNKLLNYVLLHSKKDNNEYFNKVDTSFTTPIFTGDYLPCKDLVEVVNLYNKYMLNMYEVIPCEENSYTEEVKELINSFKPMDPYEYSFLMFYLADCNDSLFWTHGPTVSMCRRNRKMLPWVDVGTSKSFKHNIFKLSGVIPPRIDDENDPINRLMEVNTDAAAMLLKTMVNRTPYNPPLVQETVGPEVEKVKFEAEAYSKVVAELAEAKAANKRLRKESHDYLVQIIELEDKNIQIQKEIKELNVQLNDLLISGSDTSKSIDTPTEADSGTYKVKQPTLIYGGGANWVKGMRPLVAGDVKFVSLNLVPAKDALRSVSAVWINTNNVNPTDVKALIKAAKKQGIDAKCFKSNGYQSCLNEIICD